MAKLAYVGLGSNLAEPLAQVRVAFAELGRIPATRRMRTSSLYISAPVGCAEAQPDYVNAVAALRTRLSPMRLLAALQAIERRHRRRRGLRNAARTLDLDLLLYGEARRNRRGLSLPHPRLLQRAFVLRPLLEIAPSARIPGRGAARRYLSACGRQRIARVTAHR
jgi:2-amino-4-hydroxy-6-hydroxymethyldihydropteridine diphosphokinase